MTGPAIEEPLLEAFLELRRRHFPLGVGDYMSALKAMERGFGTGSRQELLRLCGTLWAKSEKELYQIESIVGRTLPRAEKRPRRPPPPVERQPERATEAGDETRAQEAGALGSPDEETAERPAPDEAAAGPGARAAAPPAGETATAAPTTGEFDLRRIGIAPDWKTNPDFDLALEPPVLPREMKRAWRGYRRSGRSGPKVVIDVDGAIDELNRKGVLVEPPMTAERSNQARLLLLVDEGGSMGPFGYCTDELLRAARGAGLARLEVRYFHDQIEESVYRDPMLRDGQALEQAAAPYVDQGILIYSDGGAARGRRERPRIAAGRRLIDQLHDVSPTVVWLNPVPASRWPDTSAGDLRAESEVPMFPLTLEGLRAAVRALHGKPD